MVVMVRRRCHDHAVRRHRRPVRDAVPGRLRGPAAQLAGGAADVHVAAVGVDHPVVALAGVVEAPRDLDETLIQRQVVPDAVLPRGRVHPVERELVHDVLVNAAEREPLLRALRYGHHDQSVVTVIGLFVFVVDRRRSGRVVLVFGAVRGLRRLVTLGRAVVDVVVVVVVFLFRFDVDRGRRRRVRTPVVVVMATAVVTVQVAGRRRRRRAAARPRAVVDRGAQAVVAAAVAGLAAGGERPAGRRAGTLAVPFVVHVQTSQYVIDGETGSV
ncbi:Uncharacterized protein FWK35_00034523 [Aphis craccivora]|uniref:Uncharacterized protein n=1 Tax=Aphis craccivora TaxID=307492 RepID=A0A6G0ZFB1_APHCR|nr:Uncharacterized protein FWK35_00034523 [Aphis craccivora]